MNYTDIHCHMLSNVDDGAQNDTQMYQMLKSAYESGTRTICFTPHFNPAFFGDNTAKIAESYDKAEEYAANILPELKLCLGNELFYFNDCFDNLRKGSCRTLNGSRYLLVDFLFNAPFVYIKNALLNLLGSGYIPVFAHVERYECIKAPFRELAELKKMGIWIQVNSTSVCGGWGSDMQKKVHKLLKKHIPDLVCSDAHNLETRHPRLDECEKIITEICNYDYAEHLLSINPSKIIGII